MSTSGSRRFAAFVWMLVFCIVGLSAMGSSAGQGDERKAARHRGTQEHEGRGRVERDLNEAVALHIASKAGTITVEELTRLRHLVGELATPANEAHLIGRFRRGTDSSEISVLIEVLSMFEDTRVTECFLERLRGKPRMDTRARIAHALGTIGDPKAIGEVGRMLLESGDDAVPPGVVVAALAKFKHEDAWGVILGYYRKAEGLAVRTQCLDTMRGWRNGTASEVAIRTAKRDAKPDVRAAAIRYLGSVQRDDHVAAIGKALLEDPHPVVRINAAAALGRSGSSAAAPYLKQALTDSDAKVRRFAELGLKRLMDNGSAQD